MNINPDSYAAGVGVWDADIRGGWWPEGRPRFPLVLGTDGAGIVAAKGALVRRFHVDDRVWAYEFINPKGGFNAQYVAVGSLAVQFAKRRGAQVIGTATGDKASGSCATSE